MKFQEKFNEITDYIKENFQLIIVLPAVLGGIWQVFELSSISTSYIRFFSVTQIIPDGLLILFYFITIYLSYKISLFIVNLNNDEKSPTNIEKSISKRSVYFSIFNVFFSTILLYYFVLKPLIIENDFIQLSDILLSIPTTTFIVTSVLYSLFNILVFIIQKYNVDIDKILEINIIKYIFAYSATFLLFTVIVLILLFFSYFSKLYKLPQNLENINNVTNTLKKKYIDKEIEILYLNDNYIFIETIDTAKRKNKIVLKFDNLFDSKTIIQQNVIKSKIEYDSIKEFNNIKNTDRKDSLISNKVLIKYYK